VARDTIEGTVTIGAQKPLPWKASIKTRGEMRVSANFGSNAHVFHYVRDS
jgi:hypothetical protein